MRTGHADRTIWCYDVTNVTKGHDYKVEFLEDVNGNPHGWCNCAASVVCKHIKTALVDLFTRVPGFGSLLAQQVEANKQLQLTEQINGS